MTRVEPDGSDPGESQRERLDRNWSELLQELRVVQTGTQIITGFLLAAVFQSRFTELDTFQLATYLCLVITSVVTTIAGLAPVSLHRYLFRKRAKEQVVAYADRFARITLVGVAITVVGITLLIFDFVLGRAWGIGLAVAVGALLVLCWVIAPQRARAADRAADAAAAAAARE
ncbi:DUF6328 family protein [Microterricola viridarii]|uniref:Sodium:proton antiporter n=1 Tax=Microterricola viridarii TaxID=412690 RepID=A0A1H1W2H0_9MICO|nr:DUF6328 family protein [Microterricola viridarii]SDS91508.1 hypothetical protein SAMN04489834_2426 [Microterricola viridarii]